MDKYIPYPPLLLFILLIRQRHCHYQTSCGKRYIAYSTSVHALVHAAPVPGA